MNDYVSAMASSHRASLDYCVVVTTKTDLLSGVLENGAKTL